MAYTFPQFPSGADLFSQDPEVARARRMASFQHYMAQYPGAAPGGTGATGLAPNDAAGWSKLLGQQQQYLSDVNGGDLGVRFGGHDPSVAGSGAGMAPPSAPRRSTPVGNAALDGLSSVISGGGGGGRLPSWLADDPVMYGALQNARLASLQGARRSAEQEGLSPVDVAGQKAEAALRFDPYVAAEQRQQDYEDAITKGQATADVYWHYGRPIQEDTYDRLGRYADVKGEAGTLDDQIRAQAQLGVANINAGARAQSSQSALQAQILDAIQREIGNARQFGDDSRVGALAPRFDAMTAGRSGGPGGAAALGSKGPLSEDRLQAVMQSRGLTRAQALDLARGLGYQVPMQ